jgi:hypothetical protein
LARDVDLDVDNLMQYVIEDLGIVARSMLLPASVVVRDRNGG